MSMTDDERYRVYNICYNSKRGTPPNMEDFKFIQEMFSKFPDEYSEVSRDAVDNAVLDYQESVGV